MFLRKSLSICLIGLLLAIETSPVFGQAAFWSKDFYANNVQADAKIDAGGVMETWSGRPINNHSVLIAGANPKPQAEITCRVCDLLSTASTGKIGPMVGQPPAKSGLPVARSPGNVSTPDRQGSTQAAGDSGEHMDMHNEKNTASASYSVGLHTAGPLAVKVRKPGGAQPEAKNLTNYASVNLFGTAYAGDIKDRHKCHATDSVVGVRIDGATDNFRVEEHGQVKVVEATGRVFTRGNNNVQPGKRVIDQANLDPYFVNLVDLTTGETWSETVMRHTVTASNGFWELDDYGIRLVVHRADPDAFVELLFDQPSSWVLNPYTYGARLDMAGLTTAGELSYGGWTVTTLTDTVEAFYAFGPDGMPYDNVAVAAPFELFNPDHDYTYDIGSSDGAYVQFINSVPEPSTLALTMLVGLLWIGRRRDTRG